MIKSQLLCHSANLLAGRGVELLATKLYDPQNIIML